MPRFTVWRWPSDLARSEARNLDTTATDKMSEEPPYSVAARWNESWDLMKFKSWALKVRRQILPREVMLGIVFISSEWIDHAEEVVDVLRNSVGISVLAGCVSNGVIANDVEYEGKGGVALGLFNLPGAWLVDLGFSAGMTNDAIAEDKPGYWKRRVDPGSEGINSWLVLAEPLHVNVEAWISTWERDFPETPLYGGLAHFDRNEKSAVIWNDALMPDGGVAIGVGGGVKLAGITAQGCTPIGEAWTVTKSKGNVLERIGNRPAFQILDETFKGISEEMRLRSRGNIFVGLAVDEYLETFRRGDFLVRNMLAADPNTGSLAVGAIPRVGQSMQFQIRDAEGASVELKELVNQCREELVGKRIFGACLSNCSGRGAGLFGEDHHDARAIYELLRPQGLVGFFGNGEFGPVGGRNFVHGYTSSVAVFTEL